MPGGAPKGSANAFKYGRYQLQRLLSDGGPKKSTALYRVIAAKEQELIASLGGDPSPQELIIIKDTIKTMLFKGSLDRYLMSLKSLVRKGRVHGVLAERTRLATHERENLRTLGLKRVAKPVDWRDALRDSAGVDNGQPEPETQAIPVTCGDGSKDSNE
jgi:hypothetical protein